MDMILDAYGNRAHPGDSGTCPRCMSTLTPKCGSLIRWHWAHTADDCGLSAPESEWHLNWKQHWLDRGARIEVDMKTHRADVVLPNGTIIEFQSDYLAAEQIQRRETHYGKSLIWVYRVTWGDRLHFGKRGFWWKHGARSMTTHRRPVWWDFGTQLSRVQLSIVQSDWTDSERVLGRVLSTKPSPLATDATQREAHP